jgi:hypothetical protein
MAKEPEQMLEQDGITAAGCIEEMCAEMPVGEQHGDRARQHWQGAMSRNAVISQPQAKRGSFIMVIPGHAC